MSVGVAKKVVRGWTETIETLGILNGARRGKENHARTLTQRRAKEPLSLNRNQLWLVVGLLTGHCHLKGTFSKWD
jgi:hypothetical protein